MNATELYKAGKLQEAIDAQIQDVKSHPADHGKRLFLFELLLFAGDLDRARRQIDAIKYGDMPLDMAVLGYRQLLDAEQLRRRLFTDGVAPQFLGDVPDHVHVRLEALNRLRENRPREALDLLERPAVQTHGLKGKLNDKPFEVIRDCDDLFGTVLEVMAKGKYFWVSLEQIDSIATNPPRFPRDLIYLPAKLITREGEQGDVFLPVLYPGSWEHPNDQIKMGHANDWVAAEGGPVRGVGRRDFLVGDDVVSLLDWRQLLMDEAVEEPEPSPKAEA
jgi:type VI secretion system protein ImpE